MQDKIKRLLPLQEVDKRIYDLRQRLESIPIEKKKLEQEFLLGKEAFENSKKHMDELKLRHKDLELELGRKEEEAKKLQAQLFQVKTNKEYSALQEKIKRAKGSASDIEDAVLSLLDEIEAEEEVVRQKEKEFSEFRSEFEQRRQEIQATEDELNKELEALFEKREGLKQGIDSNLLRMYEKLVEHNGGLALCSLSKDGVCSGCFVKLPMQVVNDLMSSDKLITCEACGRILYLEGDD